MNNNIIVKENERLVLPVVWFGKEAEISYNIQLAGVGSELTFLMLLLGEKEHKVKIQVNVDHQAQETKSKVIVKGVINDSASVDFNGLVKIEKGSKHANAWLSANLLLLSNKAKGRTVPSLEILENDVKAGHATTVGRVNDSEIFYLMSRGLSKNQAEKLIIQGFLDSFIKQFPEGSAKQQARRLSL